MMTESEVIDGRDLPNRIQNLRPSENAVREVQLSLDKLACLHAQRVVAHVGGNKVRAAEILAISRTYLYELFKEIRRIKINRIRIPGRKIQGSLRRKPVEMPDGANNCRRSGRICRVTEVEDEK